MYKDDYKAREQAKENKYKKYIKMIQDKDDFNSILSTFLIYCNDNNIPWSMSMLFNKSENTLEEQQLLEESQRFISEYNNWK